MVVPKWWFLNGGFSSPKEKCALNHLLRLAAKKHNNVEGVENKP